ncbi:MAG: NUDIX hydrolase N-terminal domain-containing protein [Herpetosiphonaceae bacterium]|nr:NUDIX hydrolase N-terminal domain-containing protein [Herpetosiphonaceae bacterium]
MVLNMEIMPLLDELRTVARNGLTYSTNSYDQERYERLLELASIYYGQAVDLPPADVRQRLAAEIGYVTPKLGADAAIFDDQGKILLMLRADDGRWCVPCGWVEPNESPAQTAVREAQEETGLDVQVVQLVDVLTRLPSMHNGPHTMVSVVYLCEIIGGTLQLSHEGLELSYWRIEDVPTWHPEHRERAEASYAAWQTRQATKVPSTISLL